VQVFWANAENAIGHPLSPGPTIPLLARILARPTSNRTRSASNVDRDKEQN